MAKVQIKSEKITPFGGLFHVRELFSSFVGQIYAAITAYCLVAIIKHDMKLEVDTYDVLTQL